MTRVVAIGSALELAGYALAGVDVVGTDDPDAMRRAWSDVAEDASLVLLTADARAALPERLDAGSRLWAVIPA